MSFFEFLKDRLLSRMQEWDKNFFSRGQGYFIENSRTCNYDMSMYLIPVRLCREI